MTFDEISCYLGAVESRSAEPSAEAIKVAIAALKRDAVARGDQTAAKRAWCLEQALSAQDNYLRAFDGLESGHFYGAWCDLEKVEIDLGFLERHDTVSWPRFRLDFIRTYTAKWQSLFPYKLFISPELLEEKECSVCHQPFRPRTPCGHHVGEIYEGEMCCLIVTKLEVLGVAFVEKPVQKYSVLFLNDKDDGKSRDHYNYAVVQYAANALRKPFDQWDIERTYRRQPHSRFPTIGRNDLCPCESGKKYDECCLPESGVLRPHLEFTFYTLPPDGAGHEMYIE
jgi:hypothetical protein